MTASECLTRALASNRVFLQAGELLFNTFEEGEADWWAREGAGVKAWYTPKELAFLNRGGRVTRQGFEVRLSPCVDAPREFLLAEWRLCRAS